MSSFYLQIGISVNFSNVNSASASNYDEPSLWLTFGVWLDRQMMFLTMKIIQIAYFCQRKLKHLQIECRYIGKAPKTLGKPTIFLPKWWDFAKFGHTAYSQY